MSAATTVLYKPTTTLTCAILPRLKSRKIISSPNFPSSKFLFSGEFVSQKSSVSLNKRVYSPNTMSGSITATSSAFMGSTSDEGVGALEQEYFIPGSSQFRPNFTAVGIESTLNRLSKWLVTGLFGAVLLWRHDAEALWAVMGSVVNVWLSTILKQILNQERPVSTLGSGPGMPSSHAQSFFFIVVFVVISMVEWLGANGLTITLSGLALAFGSYMSWLRVSQQMHTISQVVVGAVLGSIFSILWFWSWDAIVLKAFISYLSVQILIVLGAAGFCLGFIIYIIRHWIMDEN